MKRPRQLHVEVEPQHTAEFLGALDAALSDGWTRALDREEQAAPSMRPLIACYRCDARPPRPAAGLALSRDRYNRFGVVIEGSLTGGVEVDDWNTIITSFHESCLARISQASRAFIGMWSDTVDVEDLMSAEAFDLLRAASVVWFSPTKPWLEFIAGLYREKHRLTPELLALWLQEQDWPKPLAEERAREFDFAQKLFDHLGESPPKTP